MQQLITIDLTHASICDCNELMKIFDDASSRLIRRTCAFTNKSCLTCYKRSVCDALDGLARMCYNIIDQKMRQDGGE